MKFCFFLNILLASAILKAVRMNQGKRLENTDNQTISQKCKMTVKETKQLSGTSQQYRENPEELKLSKDFLQTTPLPEPMWPFDEIILMARRILQLQTLVIFAESPKNLKNFQGLMTLAQDKVIITQPQTKQLRELFSSNSLSIVFIEKPFINELFMEILTSTLDRWHLKKLLFLTPISTLEPIQQWLQLFEWLHNEGFWNTLLMDSQQNTLTMDHFSLTLLYNTLTLEQFFHLSTDWLDLKGYEVHVSVANNPPRALIYHDQDNQLQLKGYFVSLLKIFAQLHNASLVPHQISDLDYYSELDCLKYIQEARVDVCGDAMAMSPHYEITVSEDIVSSYLMVPYDTPLPRFYYFIKPFQGTLWALVWFAFLYDILTLALIYRVQHNSWWFTVQLQYATLSLINLPFELKRVRGPLRRYLEILLILKGFVASNWYLALLTSLLYTRLYSQDINSLEDLQRRNITILVNQFEYSLLNNSDIDPIISQQLLLVPDEVLLENRRNLNPQYAYYSQYDKNDFYLCQQKFLLRPVMKELTQVPINSVLAGIPMRSNWPFAHLLNNIMARNLDRGLYVPLLIEANEQGIRSGYLKYFPTEYRYVEPLGAEYFQLPALILAGGFLMGLVSFMLEILYFKWFERK